MNRRILPKPTLDHYDLLPHWRSSEELPESIYYGQILTRPTELETRIIETTECASSPDDKEIAADWAKRNTPPPADNPFCKIASLGGSTIFMFTKNAKVEVKIGSVRWTVG